MLTNATTSQMVCEMFRYSSASFTDSKKECSLYMAVDVLSGDLEARFCTSGLFWGWEPKGIFFFPVQFSLWGLKGETGPGIEGCIGGCFVGDVQMWIGGGHPIQD